MNNFARLVVQGLIIILGLFVTWIAILTAKDGRFLKIFYWYDNEEDGYTGNKRGWYSAYLERDLTFFDHWWWCTIRNPAWNLRYAPWLSCSVAQIDVTTVLYKGNTTVKNYDQQALFVRETLWWKFSADVEGERRASSMWLIPMGAKRSLRILIGWKFYPDYYVPVLQKIPKYKQRAIYVFSIRIVKL